MNLHVSIGGDDVTALALFSGTQIQKDSTDAISTATLVFRVDHDNAALYDGDAIYDDPTYVYGFTPREWQEVILTDDGGDRHFAGYIVKIDAKQVSGNITDFTCTCSDYGILLDSDGGILGVLFRIQESTQYLNPLLDGLNAKLIDWLAPLNDTLGSIDQKGYWALEKLDEVRDGITDMRAKVQAHLDIAQQSVQILDQVRAGINNMTSGRGSFTINIQGGTAADRNMLQSAFTQLRAQGAMI